MDREIKCKACGAINHTDEFCDSVICTHCGFHIPLQSPYSEKKFHELKQAVIKKVLEDITRAVENNLPTTDNYSPTYSVAFYIPSISNISNANELEHSIRKSLLDTEKFTHISVRVYPDWTPDRSSYSEVSVNCELSDQGVNEYVQIYKKKNHVVADAVNDATLGIVVDTPGCGCAIASFVLLLICGLLIL